MKHSGYGAAMTASQTTVRPDEQPDSGVPASRSIRPRPRGPWSRLAFELLDTAGHRAIRSSIGRADLPDPPHDPLRDDDFQLALYLCNELHFRGVGGVADDAEWDPGVHSFRRTLEFVFEESIRQQVPHEHVCPPEVPGVLRALDAASTFPVARFLERQATLEQFREFVAHRSAYHLKEADPHTFALPRLTGATKTAFAGIQADEYGGGRPFRMHSTLFAGTMRQLGLDPTYGAYIDLIPGATLTTVNLMSLFGLHRRLRGAAVGHLALFELGSSVPNRMYGNGLRRLGFSAEATDFFDEHVEADAAHAMIATYDMAGRLAVEEPDLAPDIVFGARALDFVEGIAGAHLLESWAVRSTSLLEQLPT
jgi:hypothetical protein